MPAPTTPTAPTDSLPAAMAPSGSDPDPSKPAGDAVGGESSKGKGKGKRKRKRKKRFLANRNLSVTTKEDEACVFGVTDLSPDTDLLSGIQVLSVAFCGLLQLDGMAVTPGQKIGRDEIKQGRLTFIPAVTGKQKYFDYKIRVGEKWSRTVYSMAIHVLPAYGQSKPGSRRS